jgi:hypothetical protein
MEIEPVVWLAWVATGAVGALGLTALARVFEAVFDLDRS